MEVKQTDGQLKATRLTAAEGLGRCRHISQLGFARIKRAPSLVLGRVSLKSGDDASQPDESGPTGDDRPGTTGIPLTEITPIRWYHRMISLRVLIMVIMVVVVAKIVFTKISRRVRRQPPAPS